MNKSDEELELRALRDMLEQAKKDILELLEAGDFASAIFPGNIDDIRKRYLPKGETENGNGTT